MWLMMLWLYKKNQILLRLSLSVICQCKLYIQQINANVRQGNDICEGSVVLDNINEGGCIRKESNIWHLF